MLIVLTDDCHRDVHPDRESREPTLARWDDVARQGRTSEKARLEGLKAVPGVVCSGEESLGNNKTNTNNTSCRCSHVSVVASRNSAGLVARPESQHGHTTRDSSARAHKTSLGKEMVAILSLSYIVTLRDKAVGCRVTHELSKLLGGRRDAEMGLPTGIVRMQDIEPTQAWLFCATVDWLMTSCLSLANHGGRRSVLLISSKENIVSDFNVAVRWTICC